MADWLPLPQVASRPGLPDRPVAWCGTELRHRARFVADVSAWHATFLAQPGRRFALYFDDGYTFAAALYGAWHAGKEIVLPGDVQAATLERLAREADGRAGVLPGAIAAPAPGARGNAAPLAPLDPQQTRTVIYTSGSGGEPLAIDKRLSQLDAEMQTLQAAFGSQIGATAAVHTTVSHQHIYGLLFHILWPLAAGRPFVSHRMEYPEEMARDLARAPCVLVSSPAHLRRLPATLDWHGARAALRAVFSSGGPLPDDAAGDALRLLGCSPIEVFGSSETGGIARRQRSVDGEHWQPLPGIEWRIDDGLLSVRSRHLADDGWWLTADRVQALPEGGFVLLGRTDRIVKIEEKRVSLSAIEQALVAGGEVAEARALLLHGQAGARLGVAAVLTGAGWDRLRTHGRRALGDRLREALAQQVERVALPRRWRFVKALPVNAQGKITEALLAALFRPAMPEPQWQSRGPAEAVAVLDIGADLLVFDGHFPQAPLVPGVAQIDWAVALGRRCFDMPLLFSQAEALKFQRPIQPGMRIELTLQWDAPRATLTFRYHAGAGVHASGRLVFRGQA
jgi:acyl-CoA synthetase (AMP-forming)/AMP-acid ligase II/3-hydroxymyristoyl/3-hydroxydecanoyl-(acyl carrier protein) dehydratase